MPVDGLQRVAETRVRDGGPRVRRCGNPRSGRCRGPGRAAGRGHGRAPRGRPGVLRGVGQAAGWATTWPDGAAPAPPGRALAERAVAAGVAAGRSGGHGCDPSGPQIVVRQQRAVSLYRQLSGKDPRVAEAQVQRVKDELLAIDERVKPYGARCATAGATADRLSWRPRPARCWPTTWLAGRPTTRCWARSRLPGWSTRPSVRSARTGRWGRLLRVSRRRGWSSAARSGRRWTATLRVAALV
jgi:hypothetical protein